MLHEHLETAPIANGNCRMKKKFEKSLERLPKDKEKWKGMEE